MFYRENISLLALMSNVQLQCPSEFHLKFKLNLKAHQPDLVSLVLAIISQHQTAHPASKAIAQTESKGNKTKPVEKLLKINNFSQYERNSEFTSGGKDRDCTK